MKCFRRLLPVLLALALLCSACSLPGRDKGEEEKVDNVKVSTAYVGLAYYQSGPFCPVTDTASVNRLLGEAMYEGLFEVGSNFTAMPVLCSDYTGDGTTFTFTLRDDVTFWSGAPLTAGDVVASLQTAVSSETSPYHNRLVEVASVEAVGDKQVRITLTSPNVNFPRLLDIPIFRDGTAGDEFADGTGPFQPVKTDGKWTLTANKTWREGFLGSIRTIELVTMSSADAVTSSFRTGDISLIREPRISPDASAIGGAVDTVQTASADLHYLGLNFNNTALQNAKVRQALSAALGRQGLCDTQLQTFADPAVLPVNPQPADTGLTLTMTADTAAATTLLRQAAEGDTASGGTGTDHTNTGDTSADDTGTDDTSSDDTGEDDATYDDMAYNDTGSGLTFDNLAYEDTGEGDTTYDDNDGGDTDEGDTGSSDTVPVDPASAVTINGETLSLTLLVNSDNAFKTAAADQIAASWRAIGVAVTVDKEPYETYASRVQQGDFDVYYGETLLTPDFDLRPLIASGGSLNYGSFSSSTMSAALDAARSGEDVTAFYKQFLAELPVIPIAFERNQLFIRRGLIDNFTPEPYNAFANLETWTSGEQE